MPHNHYIVLNNSRIDVVGKISDYINDKLYIDIKASGNIIANDINSFLPKELRATAVGKLPLSVDVTGDMKSQNIDLTLKDNEGVSLGKDFTYMFNTGYQGDNVGPALVGEVVKYNPVSILLIV